MKFSFFHIGGCGRCLLGLEEVRVKRIWGRNEAMHSPFFLFPIFNLRQVSQIWREKRNVSLWLLNVFRGAGVSGRQTEKKQVNLKAGLLILPEEVCTPGVEPKEALEGEHSLPNKSNNLPLFYQQFSKARFPGLEQCHPLLPLPQAPAATFHPCMEVTGSLLSEDQTPRFRISPPNPRRLPSFS